MNAFYKNYKIDLPVALLSFFFVVGCCLMVIEIKNSVLGEPGGKEVTVYFEKQQPEATPNIGNPKESAVLSLKGLPKGVYEIGLIEPGVQSKNKSTKNITVGKTVAAQLNYSKALEQSLLVVKKGAAQRTFYILKEGKPGEYQAINIESSEGMFDYSHNQRELAFVNAGNIWKVAADGSFLIQLTHSGRDENPRWSPDDVYLAFTSTRDNNSEIYVIDTDGKNAENLTQSPHKDENPAWAPDGLKIAFNSNRAGMDGIYIVYTQSKRTRRLTNGEIVARQPLWSPNGKKIAFLSTDWKGSKNLYAINFGGREQVQLSSLVPGALGDESNPAWMSINEIAYTNQWNKNREFIHVTAQKAPVDITSFIAFRALVKTVSF
jgi:dipeptidyl aminopeptidase/acylaminoacyl peptidase